MSRESFFGDFFENYGFKKRFGPLAENFWVFCNILPSGLPNLHSTCPVKNFEQTCFFKKIIFENTLGFGLNLSNFLDKCINRANNVHSTCQSEQLEVRKLFSSEKT